MTVLESSCSLFSRWEDHSRHMQRYFPLNECFNRNIERLASIRLSLHYFHRAVFVLLEYSSGTADLVSIKSRSIRTKAESICLFLLQLSKINQYRQHEELYKCSGAVQSEISSMRNLTMLAQQESRTVTRLAEESLKHAKTVKTWTLMATLYLPASLMAVSNLIHLQWQRYLCNLPDNLQLQSRPNTIGR